LFEVHDRGEYTQTEIAEVFSISRATVYRELQHRREKFLASCEGAHLLAPLEPRSLNSGVQPDTAAARWEIPPRTIAHCRHEDPQGARVGTSHALLSDRTEPL
jgi:hypothetical protein